VHACGPAAWLGRQYVRSLAVEVARSEAIDAADPRAAAKSITVSALWSTLVVPGLTAIDTLSTVASGHGAELELRVFGRRTLREDRVEDAGRIGRTWSSRR
jgi:hypothetical protein